MPPSEIHVKRFESNEADVNEFVFPCSTGEILQEGQPLPTTVYQAEEDLKQQVQ